MGTQSKASRLHQSVMKSALILTVVLGIVAYADAAKIAVASGKLVHGTGGGTFTFTVGTVWGTADTVTITCDRPIFGVHSANADKITSITDSGGTKLNGATGATTATALPIVGTSGTATATGVITVAVAAGITIVGDPGLYSFTVVSSNADTISDAFLVPVSAAATPAVGLPSMATSQLQGASPGAVTFKFGVNAAVADTKKVTFTASEAIYATSQAAATSLVTSCNERLGTAAAATCDTASTSTFETDSTGKIGIFTLVGDALSNGMTVELVIAAGAFATNPATAGLVTLSVVSNDGVTNAGTQKYPVYPAATTALFMGATIGTDEKSVDPATMVFKIVPQTTLAAAGKYTITASSAIFKNAAPAVACSHGGATSQNADCTAGTVTTAGVELVVTLNNHGATAGYPLVISVSSETANNGATPGAGPTFSLVASAGDTTASTGNAGYTIFNAALTAYFTSGVVTPLSATSTPTSLVATFVPQTKCVGSTDKVTITASTAIFTASATPTVACATTANRYPVAVTCTSASDSTGKILTVTLTGTAGAVGDLTDSRTATVTVTSGLAANAASGTATTFAFETSKDTTGVTAQTGFTTTAAPVASSANSSGSGTAATGTTTTVTQVYTFASLTVAAYTGKMKSNCECAYANTVGGATTPLWCTATTSAYNYISGVAVTSVAAHRRSAKVTFTLKVKSSVKSTAQLQTLVASGSTASNFATALAAVNTASNYTAAPGAATVATATFTGGSSSASTLLPSMLSLVAAIFVAARQ